MVTELLRMPLSLGLEIALGSGLMLSATVIGWVLGRRRSFPMVRWVSRWMHSVVLPLVSCRSWAQRTGIIFGNNCLVLAGVTAAGVWTGTAAVVIGFVGLALGIALRCLSEFSPYWSPPGPNCPADVRRRIRIGVGLNLLEPPAIALAVGLAIGRSQIPLEAAQVWGVFALLVVPLLLAAACGEALWLGVGLQGAECANVRRRAELNDSWSAERGPVQCSARQASLTSASLVKSVALVALLPGALCGSPPEGPAAAKQSFRAVCTFLPIYVFTLNVVGDAAGVEVDWLVAPDTGCPHDYAVRPADLKRIGRASAIIANGLGMEPFLDELLQSFPSVRRITISDDCELIRTEHSGDHEHHAGCDHDHSASAVNGHVWVSPRQAAIQVRTLGRKLAEFDPARAETYRTNAAAYAARLDELSRTMTSAAEGFGKRRIVTSHDAFDYLARDLNLKVTGTLNFEPGRSLSGPQMVKIVQQVRDDRAAAIFFEPGAAERTARVIGAEADVPVFPLNPFTSAAGKPLADSYEMVMADNLRVLQRALGTAP